MHARGSHCFHAPHSHSGYHWCPVRPRPPRCLVENHNVSWVCSNHQRKSHLQQASPFLIQCPPDVQARRVVNRSKHLPMQLSVSMAMYNLIRILVCTTCLTWGATGMGISCTGMHPPGSGMPSGMGNTSLCHKSTRLYNGHAVLRDHVSIDRF